MIKEEIKKKIEEVLNICSRGGNATEKQTEQIKYYGLLDWCLNHLIDQYLGQSETIVTKSIQNDSPIPLEIKELLYSYELSNKNRINILKILK